MKDKTVTWHASVGLLAGLLLVLGAGKAEAQDGAHPTQGRMSVAFGPRYATEGLYLGLGADAGYTLPMGMYVGGMFDYYVGAEDYQNGPSYWVAFAEGGYDIGLADRVVVRPVALLGIFGTRGKGACAQEVRFGLGAHGHFMLGEILFARALMRLFVDEEIVVLSAGAGVGFVL